MDIGTILLIIAIAAGIFDAIILLAGPRIKKYEQYSFYSTLVAFIASVGGILWMTVLIFTNQFQYEYVTQVTNIGASILLKISALWAGQSGSLVFWTFLSFTLYFGFRVASRGYEDDKLVYRASIIMVLESVFVALNTLIADPFRLVQGIVPTDGLGLNPLLSTIWNVIHPPIIFIAYALVLVPFSVKLAGFTLRSDERTKDPIPIVNAYVRFATVFAWVMLSAGIAIGGYWAYIVLGWGGYWAWDPVETTSLIPWLLITAYYHAKPIFRKNDVLRDSFLVTAYIAVLFATWTTRSGIVASVHGFGISLVGWTMLITLIANLVVGIALTFFSGLRDMQDDDDSSGFSFFKEKDIRLLSIKIAFIGLLIVTATSAVGVVYPAVFNLGLVISDPASFASSQIGIRIEFFQYGFYAACVLLIGAAFFCLRITFLNKRIRLLIMGVFFAVGGGLAALTIVGGFGPLPTNFWFANLLVLPAIGAIVFLVIAFVRQMAGKDKIVSTRELGRLMLHLGLIILLLGVFMSENVVYESNAGFLQDSIREVAPSTYVQVTNIDLEHWTNEYDFNLIVELRVIEMDAANNTYIIGIGYSTVTGHPGWNMVSHQIYLQSTVFRDVFIAVTGFSQVAPGVYQVTIHTKILPFVSFVWLGPFLMITAMLPMFGMEVQALLRAFKGKEKDLYEDVPEESEEPMAGNESN
jgi:cytochrome c-type biogenesis protein CcmF